MGWNGHITDLLCQDTMTIAHHATINHRNITGLPSCKLIAMLHSIYSHSPSPLSPCVPFSYEHDVKSSQEVSASQEQCQEEDEEKQEDTSCSGSQLAPVASFMDNIVMSMRESPEKLVTDSDVQALLNNASTSSSKPILPLSKKLKKEKKEPIKRQKEEEKIISPNESVSVRKKALTDGLVVSHGHPKSVTASILLDGLEANQVKPIQQKRKKRKLGPLINDNSDEEEDEIIDPVKVSSDTLQLSTRLRQGAAGGGGVEVGKDQLTMGAFYNQPEKLMVRINLRHFNKNPDTHFDREIRPLSPPPAVPPISSPSSSYMYSSAVTLDDSNKHVVLRLSKPLEPDTELLKRSHKSKKKKKSKGH